MPVDKVRKLINAIDNNNTGFHVSPFIPLISKELRDLVGIPEPIDKKRIINEKTMVELRQTMDEFKQQTKDELRQSMDEFKQQSDNELRQTMDELKQQTKDIQELLINFIKNSNV